MLVEMRLRFVIWMSLLAGPLGLLGQHYGIYSHYMFNPLSVNPAYAGSRDHMSATAIYRHQWVGIHGAPRTQGTFLHTPLRDPRNNLGLSLVYDKLGLSSDLGLQLAYAYRIALGKSARLSFGLQGGVSMLQSRPGNAVTDQSGDAVFQGGNTIWVPGAGFGIYFDTRRFYVGLSTPQLLTHRGGAFQTFVGPDSATYKPALLTAGCLLRINPDVKLRPSILLKHVPHTPLQVDVNANLILKDRIWLGLGYRNGDALVAMLEWDINPQLRLGYAYDYSVSPLRKVSSGSHEIMLRYEFGYRLKAMSPRYF